MTQERLPITGALRRMGIHPVWDGVIPCNEDEYRVLLDSGVNLPSWEEVIPYIAEEQAAASALLAQVAIEKTDAGMARFAEDLFDTLVAKGVLAMADLPQAAQDKIAARKQIREEL